MAGPSRRLQIVGLLLEGCRLAESGHRKSMSESYDHFSLPGSNSKGVARALYSLKHNELVAALAKPVLSSLTRRLERVIFTATTGRSGTMTLSKLFATVPGCVALHEPYPPMSRRVLQAASYGDAKFVEGIYWHHKSLNIRRKAIGFRYYMEANELFVKTFIQHAIEDFGERVAVIHLIRPPIEVANSLFCLEHYPGTNIGNDWFLDYRAPTNLIRIPHLLERATELSHPFYKALWYWHEVEARIFAWRSRNPSVRVTRFETDWLNDKARIITLFDDLDIRYDASRIDAVAGRRENLKLEQRRVAPVSEDDAGQMLLRFQALLLHYGVNPSIMYKPSTT